MKVKFSSLLIFFAFSTSICSAHEYQIGPIKIEHPWSRETFGASVGAGYFTITNTGSVPDRLISATATVSGRVEFHKMEVEDSIMKMRPQKDGIIIAPGKTVEFKPGSLHLMLNGLHNRLQRGQKVKGTLTFEKAGTVDIEYAVEAIKGPSTHPAPTKEEHHHH